MMLDMNSEGTLTAEAICFPDWPFTPPPRPVRDQIIIRGSMSAGVMREGHGSPDGVTPSAEDPLT